MSNDTILIVRLSMQLGRAMSLLESIVETSRGDEPVSDEMFEQAVDAIGGWHRFMYETNFPEEGATNENRPDKDG